MQHSSPTQRILSLAIIIVLFLITSVPGFGQLDAVVEWDLDKGSIGKLPYDIPFTIKIKNKKPKEKIYELIIWSVTKNRDHNSIKEIILNGEIYYRSFVSSKDDFLIHRALCYPEMYGIALFKKEKLSPAQIKKVIKELDFAPIIAAISSDVQKIKSEATKSGKPVTNEIQKFFEDGIKIPIIDEVNTKFPKLIFDGFTGRSEVLDEILRYVNDTTIDLDANLKTKIKKDLSSRLSQYVSKAIVSSTFANETSARFLEKIYTVFGIGGTYINNEYVVTNIGFNYFFKGYNDKITINKVENNFLRRLSIHASVNFINLSDGFLDKKKRFGLFNDQSLFLGAGFMVDDGIVINAGGMFFREAHENPLITDKSLQCSGFVNINIDSRLWNKYKK